MTRHQTTIFEVLQEVPQSAEAGKARLTQLPAPVLPPQPAPPPLPLLQKGQQVIVLDPAGDWVGVVHYDDGELVDILQGQSKTPISYPRNQLKAIATPSPNTQQTWDEALQQIRENPLPKVDCSQCQHFRPYTPLHRSWSITEKAPITLYECGIRVFPGPASLKGIYGLHIGCRSFEEKES